MLVLIYLIEFIIKKEVMGGGDIKLFAMVGLFLGIKLGLLNYTFKCICRSYLWNMEV